MDIEELKKTAELAMLELDEKELQALSEAVGVMLEHFACMNEIDVDDLEPTTHSLGGELPLRSDLPATEEARDIDPRELVERASGHDESYFVVPNVL
ncbi:MAG: Asp-tRNA(Asn)/Glu-tRNA(Gln) amidotransferase subunit GatC [Spirochaetota bacterium]